MSQLKKTLGKWKCKLFDEWPYLRRVKQMPEVRRRLVAKLDGIPTIYSPNPIKYEIHMLCGHRDYDMGIWASWSLMRFMDGAGKLYVHSDGSLTEEDIKMWKKVIDSLVVIPRDEADAKVASEYREDTKHLYDWRCNYGTSPQLVDSHLYGEAPGIIVMDSDVLVFSKPKELLDSAVESEVKFVWCHDVRNAYSTTPELMKEVTGITLPDRFNCGMLVTPRLTRENHLKLDEIMEQIHQDGRIDLRRYWACQTYYALLSTDVPGSKALPKSYATTMGATAKDAVLRHYVGAPSIRFRYFTEGVPRVLAGEV